MSFQKAFEIAEFLKSKGVKDLSISVVLGTGISKIMEHFTPKIEIPYSEISGFPVSTVKGHTGRIIFSHTGDKKVAFFCGRFHYYEGYSMEDVVLPVRVSKFLGAEVLVLTNAAGGLNPSFKPGDIMVITDHINLFPENPLRGKNDENIGPRFPSMINAYDPLLRKVFIDSASEDGINIKEGIYAGWQGPNLETKAEYRFLRIIGADAVGMSTVPEAIAGKHLNMKILGISIITNMGIGEITPHSHEDVIRVAEKSSELLGKILIKWIKKL